MRKLIAAINTTLDGYCDHTAISPDEEIHDHYRELLKGAGTLLYGRVTYQLMEYWREVLTHPTGNPSLDSFAETMDRVPKLVFSRTLREVDWDTARLATRSLQEEVADLKKEPGKDLYVGSPGLIVELTNLGLIDEYQLCIHPVLTGKGNPLFKNLQDRLELKLFHTKTFGSGAVIHYYSRISNA